MGTAYGIQNDQGTPVMELENTLKDFKAPF